MNNKDFCKWVDFRFKSEKHKQRGPFGGYHYLVRLGSDTMYFSSGDTESQAWREAKDEIMSKAEHYFKLKYPKCEIVQLLNGLFAIRNNHDGFSQGYDILHHQKTDTNIWQNALKAAFKHNNQ